MTPFSNTDSTHCWRSLSAPTTVPMATVTLAPQRDVHRGSETRYPDTCPTDHRLGAARGGDEAEQLRDGRLTGGGQKRQGAPFAQCLKARRSHVHQPPGRQVLGDREPDRERHPADAATLLQCGGLALKHPLPRIAHST